MKKIKILTIVLAVVLVTMVAFFGVYVPTQNRMEDKVKDYSYSTDLKGARNVKLKVDDSNKTVIKDSNGNEVEDSEELTDEKIAEKGYTKEETPYNTEEVLNKENYQESKKIIEKRLGELNVDDYNIRVDENTGDILVKIPENNSTDSIVSSLATVGKFEIIDSQTKEVLMDNSDIELVNVMYGSNSSTATSSSGTTVYLNIEFTKDGTKKLEDISNKYVKTINTTTTEDTTNSEDTTTEKKISMMIDGEEIMSTSFDETIKTGKLQLSVGSSSTDNKILQGYIEQASSMAVVLDSGKIPVKYNVDENQYILSDITNQESNIMDYYAIILIVIVVLSLIGLVVRYKINGLLASISYIGMFSILLLVIRYANVSISIQSILGITITLILNYMFINKLLSKLKKEKTDEEEIAKIEKDTYKEFFIKITPICIAVIVFCFTEWVPISSFGMTMFWGIVLIAIYNFIITDNLLKIKASR